MPRSSATTACSRPEAVECRPRQREEAGMAWTDQVAVVTGGGRGIGRASARLLAQRGAAVCVNYVAQREPAERGAAEIVPAGGRAVGGPADGRGPAAAGALSAGARRAL